mgnify:FL=1
MQELSNVYAIQATMTMEQTSCVLLVITPVRPVQMELHAWPVMQPNSAKTLLTTANVWQAIIMMELIPSA